MQSDWKPRWTEEEVAFLKFAYPNKEFSLEEIMQALPGRTLAAIRRKARLIGVERYKPPKPPQGYKRCVSCDTILPLTWFHNDKRRGDGKFHYCKICVAKLAAKRADKKVNDQIDVNDQINVNPIIKKCKKCNLEKPLTEFYKNHLLKDGYKNSCKACERKAYRKWYIKGGY